MAFRSVVALLSFTAVLSSPSAASALGASTPIPGEERFQGLQQPDEMSIGAGLGIGQVDEDWFFTITPRFDLNLGKIGLGLQGPVLLRVIDEDPDNPGVLREQDWDEFQDYFKLVRYFRFGQKGDFIYLRIGELAGRLGHGTIVDRYMNNIDIDTFRLGLVFDLNTAYGGFETLIGDVANLALDSPDSKLVGARFYLNPVALADPTSFFNIFSIGVSVVTDATAPTVVATDANGNSQVDGKNNPIIAENNAAVVYGVDLEARLLNNDLIKLTPYTDMNFIHKAGFGWHLGVLLNLFLPVGFDLQLPVRLEYRMMRDDYIPTYFSTFYELERYRYPLAPRAMPGDGRFDGQPKLRWARRQAGTEIISGWYGDLAFDFAGMFQIGGLLEGYGDAGPNFSLFLNVPALDAVKFKAYYERSGINGAGDLFGLDDRSMLVAQLAINPYSFIYIVGRWTRQWTLQDDANTPDLEYEPTDSWNVGVEFAFPL